MRCLIVEDDPSLAELLRLEFGDHDVQASCVHSISAALDALAEAPPDALVIDLTLPDGSGLEVALAARRMQLPCPAMIYTGAAETDALAIFRGHSNVRAVVRKRGAPDDARGLARSVVGMMQARGPAPIPAAALGAPLPRRTRAAEPAGRAAVPAGVVENPEGAWPPRRPAPVRSPRRAASGEGLPKGRLPRA